MATQQIPAGKVEIAAELKHRYALFGGNKRLNNLVSETRHQLGNCCGAGAPAIFISLLVHRKANG
jgi:hypothetical protein